MTLSRLFPTLLFAASTAVAQVQAGRIVGTVYDPNHAVVPNAAVVITNIGTNQARNLATNNTGEFVLTPVNPGTARAQKPLRPPRG